MKVALVEFIDEFEALKRCVTTQGLALEDFTVIALDPSVGAYIKKHGHACVNTLDYFNNTSHARIIVETQKVMDQLAREFVFTDDLGLRNCYLTALSSHVRFYLNHLFKTLEILENCLNTHKQFELWAFTRNYVSGEPLIVQQERYAGQMVRRFADAKGLKFVDFGDRSFAEPPLVAKKSFGFLKKAYARILLAALSRNKMVLTSRPNDFWRGLLDDTAQHEQGTAFLAIDFGGPFFQMVGYNTIVGLRSLFKLQGTYCYFFDPLFVHKRVNGQIRQDLENKLNALTDRDHGIKCVYGAVDCSDLVGQKIMVSFGPHVLTMYAQAVCIDQLFSWMKSKAVLTCSSLNIMGVASELACRRGIKAIFVSNGAHPAPVDKYHEMELSNLCRGFMLGDYTHITLANPVQEKHLTFFKGKNKNTTHVAVKTGPLIFSDLKGRDKLAAKRSLGFSGDEIVITHAVTTKNRSSERFHFLETVDEMLASLADVVKAVGENKDFRLVIRLHPGFYLSDNEIKAFLPDSPQILLQRRGKFTSVLAATDILISFSSTAIDEAIMNRIPVVLYDQWQRYNHFQAPRYSCIESIDKFLPITYVESKEQLQGALRALSDKVSTKALEEMDISQYVYGDDHRDNYYKLITQSFKAAGG